MSPCALDIGLLQAGASMKGEFEQRLRQVIDEVQASPKPIILFIDEIHTLVGAGGAAGTGDAANLLKPALARGTLRTIGATTWAEYKKYIEKDPALTRRFQVVQVDEPERGKGIVMMRGVASPWRNITGCNCSMRRSSAAVRLSHRYIPGTPVARQGGQPARYRLCPGGGQPARRAARSRRLPPPHRGPADRAGYHRP
jgi:type VI secretion system protein VasG